MFCNELINYAVRIVSITVFTAVFHLVRPQAAIKILALAISESKLIFESKNRIISL